MHKLSLFNALCRQLFAQSGAVAFAFDLLLAGDGIRASAGFCRHAQWTLKAIVLNQKANVPEERRAGCALAVFPDSSLGESVLSGDAIYMYSDMGF